METNIRKATFCFPCGLLHLLSRLKPRCSVASCWLRLNIWLLAAVPTGRAPQLLLFNWAKYWQASFIYSSKYTCWSTNCRMPFFLLQVFCDFNCVMYFTFLLLWNCCECSFCNSINQSISLPPWFTLKFTLTCFVCHLVFHVTKSGRSTQLFIHSF